jgi:hypothetical protein
MCHEPFHNLEAHLREGEVAELNETIAHSPGTESTGIWLQHLMANAIERKFTASATSLNASDVAEAAAAVLQQTKALLGFTRPHALLLPRPTRCEERRRTHSAHRALRPDQ